MFFLDLAGTPRHREFYMVFTVPETSWVGFVGCFGDFGPYGLERGSGRGKGGIPKVVNPSLKGL